MSPLLRLVLPVAVLAALLAPPRDAGALMQWPDANVVAVNDGDTFDVDTDDDGEKDARVRMLGLQAMELNDYIAKTGDCHGPEAFQRLEQLIEGKQVRLSALDPGSTGLKGRIQRFVEVNRAGVWVDVAKVMLREGHALWFPDKEEYVNNVAYQRAARYARNQGVGLWDRDACGVGPQQDAWLRMWVQWDADGVDANNVNGEWVKIKNLGSEAVSLGGWMLRDSALRANHSPTSPLRHYIFPAGVSIPPGGALKVHVGYGVDTPTTLFWGQSEPIFENADPNGRFDGDGAYLFDPDGDLRADFMYPCLAGRCPDPNKPHVRVGKIVYDPKGVDVAANESITLRIPKTSPATAVSLDGYLLENWPYSYEFPTGTVLRRGHPLKVVMGVGIDTATTKYWGFVRPVLNNTGDTAKVRTFDNIVLHCRNWGNQVC